MSKLILLSDLILKTSLLACLAKSELLAPGCAMLYPRSGEEPSWEKHIETSLNFPTKLLFIISHFSFFKGTVQSDVLSSYLMCIFVLIMSLVLIRIIMYYCIAGSAKKIDYKDGFNN